MKEENILPADFDGVFKFTNFTDEDFTAMWDKVAYTFPANKTSPMIIGGATPKEVESIRKKFARELAVREWYKTPKFIRMNAPIVGTGNPALYTDSDIAPFSQRCLEPLPIAPTKAVKLPSDKDSNYSESTQIIDKNVSLRQGGSDLASI